MKINRFVALAAIALLVLATMSVISARTFAQPRSAPAAQSQDCGADQADGAAEVRDAGPDTDNVELQCGDQNETDGAEAKGAESEGQDTAPAGTPAITAAAAQKVAEAYLNAGAAAKVELDDENGQLVYSVEFSGGTDVKVDATTGQVLGADTGQD